MLIVKKFSSLEIFYTTAGSDYYEVCIQHSRVLENFDTPQPLPIQIVLQSESFFRRDVHTAGEKASMYKAEIRCQPQTL